MAYNTNTERLLNAIKNNTANFTIDASGGITVNTEDLITAINAQDTDIAATATNTAATNTSVQGLQGDNTSTGENTLYEIATAVAALTADNASNTGNNVTLEDLRLLLNTIDGDTGTIDTKLGSIETNSDTSLGKNGCKMVSGADVETASSGTYAAVQFIAACTPTVFTMTSSTTIVDVEILAGTIIYGDITAITGDGDAFYILYNV